MTNFKNIKLLRIILVLAILINCAVGFILLKKLYYTYPQPKKASTKMAYFLNRQQYFEVFPKDSNSIIFLGNSLTQNFEVTELLKDLRIKNRGIYGDYTAGVLNRISPIIQAKPKKVFIEIGLNDLLHNISTDTVFNNYSILIDTLINTGSKVYVQSLLPISNIGEAENLPNINNDITKLNSRLKEYALAHKATYIDLHSRFSLNGKINPKYFIPDGEHVSGEGYLLWADLVRPYVNE